MSRCVFGSNEERRLRSGLCEDVRGASQGAAPARMAGLYGRLRPQHGRRSAGYRKPKKRQRTMGSTGLNFPSTRLQRERDEQRQSIQTDRDQDPNDACKQSASAGPNSQPVLHSHFTLVDSHNAALCIDLDPIWADYSKCFYFRGRVRGRGPRARGHYHSKTALS